MASVDEAAVAFLEQQGAPMTAENMNRAKEFLFSQQAAHGNRVMSAIDQGRNLPLGGMGSMFDDFVARSDGQGEASAPSPSQEPSSASGPPNSQASAPSRGAAVPAGGTSSAPEPTPPTPGTKPTPPTAQGQASAQGPANTGVAANVPMGGEGAASAPGGDSLADEVLMAAAGARAVGGSGENASGSRQVAPSQPPAQDAQFEGVRGNGGAETQRALPGPTQSQASQSLPGAGQRAEQLPGQGASSGRLSSVMQSRLQGGDQGQRQLPGPSGDPVEEVAGEARVTSNASRLAQQFAAGEVDAGTIADQAQWESVEQVDMGNGQQEPAHRLRGQRGTIFHIGANSGQVYMNGRPIPNTVLPLEKVNELITEFGNRAGGVSRAVMRGVR